MVAKGLGCGSREGSEAALERKHEGSLCWRTAVYLDGINATLLVMICTTVLQNIYGFC